MNASHTSKTVAYWLPDSFVKFFAKFGFTENDINEAAKRAGVEAGHLCEIKVFENGAPKWGKSEDLGRRGQEYRTDTQFLRGREYRATFAVNGPLYAVSYQYAHLCHKDILFELLASRFPWLYQVWIRSRLRIYNLDLYNDRVDDFYIVTEDNVSVYVPFDAFLNRDIEAIEKRHTDYANGYYGRDPERAAEFLPREIAALDSKIWRRVKKNLRASK